MYVILMHIELTFCFQYFTEKEKKHNITKYGRKGIQHFDLLQKTF